MTVYFKGQINVRTAETPPGPVATDDTATTDWNATVTIPVLVNDTGNTSINIQSVDDSSALGTVTQSGNNLIYDPNGQFNGSPFGVTDSDSFSYTIVDSFNQTDSATVNVTVNRQPVASPVATDETATTDFDLTVTIPVLDNDTGDSISIQSVDTSGTQGTAAISGSDIIYDPNGQFNGPPFNTTESDSFSYTIVDSFNQTDSATVNITVNKGSPPAPVATDDTITTDWNSTVTIPVLDNDTGDSISIQSIDISSTQGTAFISGPDIIYDPSGQFDGSPFGTTDSDSLSYTIKDSVNQTDSATVNITINRQPAAPPVATNDTIATNFDSTVTIPVLNNDSGNSISIQSINDSNTTGTVNQSGSDIIYDPNGQFNGLAQGSSDTDTFSYTIVDSLSQTDSATVIITVENPAPVAFNDQTFLGGTIGFSFQDVQFNNAGTLMFALGGSPETIYQFDLPVSFDIGTVSFSNISSVISSDPQPKSLTFDPNGTRLFVAGDNNLTIFQFNLSPAFDISSRASGGSINVSSQMGACEDVAFNSDGSRMFVAGYFPDGGIFQYDLLTNYEISSAVFSNTFLDTSAQDERPSSVRFSNDGTRLFILGDLSDFIYQYNLSTAFDITTATFSKSLDVRPQDIGPNGFAFNPTGTRLFLAGGFYEYVYQYDLSAPFEIG